MPTPSWVRTEQQSWCPAASRGKATNWMPHTGVLPAPGDQRRHDDREASNDVRPPRRAVTAPSSRTLDLHTNAHTGVTVAPLTTTIREIPTEVVLTPEEDGVYTLCAVNLDNIQTVARGQLKERKTALSAPRMREVDTALLFALGVDEPG